MKRCLACTETFESAAWVCPRCGAQPTNLGPVLAFAPEIAQGDGTDATYCHRELAEAEARHFWFQARRDLIVWALRRYLGEPRRVLEIGCGTGFVLAGLAESLPQADLTGSDVLLEWMPTARALVPRASIVQMDARRIPFRDEFDAVCAFDVIEHITEDERVLAEIHAALRPGGGLLVTVPQHPALWSAVDDFSRHKRRYTRRELAARLKTAGFETLRLTSFFSFLMPALALARLRPRPATFDPTAELRISGPINRAFAALAAAEQAVVRAGISLPAGSSLLAVARKR